MDENFDHQMSLSKGKCFIQIIVNIFKSALFDCWNS